jgi:hypothetical protein
MGHSTKKRGGITQMNGPLGDGQMKKQNSKVLLLPGKSQTPNTIIGQCPNT